MAAIPSRAANDSPLLLPLDLDLSLAKTKPDTSLMMSPTTQHTLVPAAIDSPTLMPTPAKENADHALLPATTPTTEYTSDHDMKRRHPPYEEVYILSCSLRSARFSLFFFFIYIDVLFYSVYIR